MSKSTIAVLACALLLASVRPVRAATSCGVGSKKSLPDLILRAMRDDEITVQSGATALFLGWAAPTKGVTFMNGSAQDRPLNPGEVDESHELFVVVRPGKSETDLQPASLVIVHMIRTAARTSREMYAASLSGKLMSAGVFTDDTDLDKRRPDPEGPRAGTRLQRLGPYDPRTTGLYASELKALCLAAKEPAIQEKIRALLKK